MTQPPMPPEDPRIISYQSAPIGELSPLRKKAIRHIRGNGIGSIILSLCFCVPAVGGVAGLAGGGREAIILFIAGLVIGLGGVCYIACGILYVIGSMKMRVPNPAWEKIVIISSYTHIGFVSAMLLLAVLSLVAGGGALPNFACGFLLNLLIILSLAQGIGHIRKLPQGA